MASMRAPGRGGMQVHAVPESERAWDSSGRQLPWGYEYADSENNLRRGPEEKGPFGKSMRSRRGTSRSKTHTPGLKVDKARDNDARVIDDIFGSLKAGLKTEDAGAAAAAALNAQASALTNTAPVAAASQPTTAKEPTEVILYGFGKDFQWAAIEFFEKVSNGFIYEDYERQPPHVKYNLSISQSRASAQRSLSHAALRKKNQYVGGDHWIKVTFDSPEAAESACYASPHFIQGYAVHAEPYRGIAPRDDAPITATSLTMDSLQTSPHSSHTLGQTSASPSSATASSTTATASAPAPFDNNRPSSHQHHHPLSQMFRAPQSAASHANNIPFPSSSSTSTALATATHQAQPGASGPHNTLRVRGAKPAVLKPAEEALLPVVSRWQQTFGWIPLVGSLFGGSSTIIGNQVPRKEDDGTFDSASASFYWKLWYFVDSVYATDFCGLKGDDDLE
ncbi:hypothetical protein EJ05DRAFT_541967 [Pseudovirgaria hyperparasitica]|uniref:RRM Nup35-type domain-containing protein n=1 Tax=Pseudovirgaria hyperparasitica TaxID=470096 RepID=A0A6A6VU96_9PEZI|nr:uncharacterized protein EJ05DRAFT_541967 [Pseudovirgaria hyperparasitica]KAF2753469.1 hypothetical protein EJ05DRAFT_541967 [Pseudovirgaria hyperparasitica]